MYTCMYVYIPVMKLSRVLLPSYPQTRSLGSSLADPSEPAVGCVTHPPRNDYVSICTSVLKKQVN